MSALLTSLKGKQLSVVMVNDPEEHFSLAPLKHSDVFSFGEIKTPENHFILIIKHSLITRTYVVFTENSRFQPELQDLIDSGKNLSKEEYQSVSESAVNIYFEQEIWRDSNDNKHFIETVLAGFKNNSTDSWFRTSHQYEQ